MSKYYNIAKTFLVSTVFLVIPRAVFAQLTKIPCPEGLRCPEQGGGLSGYGVASVNGFLSTIIGWLLGIAFGLTVLFLVIGGLRYVVAGGNEESAEKAKKT